MPLPVPCFNRPFTNMHPTIPNALLGLMFLQMPGTVLSMCSAAVAIFAIGLLPAKNDVARARGLDKIAALSHLCFAMPLAVFGAEHFALTQVIMQLVPAFMPWHLFWTYLVGVALLAASLSIATEIEVRWSGLLFGIMMFLFVGMMDLPGTLANAHNRFSWTLMLREMSFGAGGWMLAAHAIDGQHAAGKKALITVGRAVIGVAAVFYGIEHFLFPVNVPGVPLEKLMPVWIPGRVLISYVTGLLLVGAGICILLTREARAAATYAGAWILLLVLLVYGPILISSLLDPGTDVKIEGINYFFDTLLFAGTILALARAVPESDRHPAMQPELLKTES